MNNTPQRRSALLLIIILLVLGLDFRDTQAAAQSEKTFKIAMAAPIGPTTIDVEYGPLTYGAQFGLTIDQSDFTTFDSHLVASQAVLSGQANAVYGSFVSDLLLRQAGQDFKMFCPTNAQIDHVLVGRNGVKTLAQVTDPKTRVGVDSPGGGADTIFNALFITHHLNVTVSNLKNIMLLQSIDTRQLAFVSNQVDTTTMRLSQFRQTQAQVPDGVIIAKPYEELPVFIFATLAAPGAWLDANRPTAAAFCASILKASVDLTRSYNTYDAAIKTVIAKPPPEPVLQESYGLITKYGFWVPAKIMNADSINFMSQIAIASGILKAAPNPEDVMDLKTYNLALSLLPAEYQNALASMGASATPGVGGAATMEAATTLSATQSATLSQ